jgi:formylglycine-generating enzyme required for sulfatase activity
MSMKEAASASLLDALRAVPDGRYSAFVAAVEASGGDQDWARPTPDRSWTVFVPTNEAFARLSETERATLLDPKNRETLRAVLDWHALPRLQVWSFDLNAGDRAPVMISENNDRFVLDVLSSGAVYVYRMRSMRDRSLEEPFKARIVAGDIPVGSSVVHVVDRVLVPPQFENSLIASQAHREKEVKELAMAADAQFMAVYELRGTLKQAESMDDAAAVAVYRVGLRMLEEVVPLSRDGMVIMGDEQSNDRTVLRDRLRARIDDLDRVWYAKFMKGSPPTTSLSEPVAGSTVPARGAAPVSAVPAAPAERGSASATSAATPASAPKPASVLAPSTLDWCEVIEKDVDPKVVTDAALREAIAGTGLPWRVREKASGIEMLLVPQGQFMMGKSPGDAEALANEVPVHAVTLSQPYYLGRYEVTKEQWSKVLGRDARTGAEGVKPGVQGVQVDVGGGRTVIVSGGYELVDSKGNPVPTQQTAEEGPDGTIVFTTTPAEAGQAGPPDTRTGLPVTAGWSKTAEFCRLAGLRLPTEAEWEFACRAGVQAPRYGELDAIAWHLGNSGGRKHPVGTKAANALGFHDMIGNAWEWVSDWYGDYTRSAKTDPTGPETGKSRIARGSFFDYEDGFCRATRRYEIQTIDSGGGVGFRVARNP